MKSILFGIGLFAGLVLWAAGTQAAEPAPDEPRKFDIPVWHSDARWEYAGPWAGSTGVPGDFTASFTYTPSGNIGADGATFMLQTDSRGLLTLGGGGGGLGYSAVSPSMAIELNIYPGAGGGVGTRYATNGATSGYTSVSPVALTSGNPIDVTLTYNALTDELTQVLSEQNTSNTWTTTYTGVDLSAVLGGNLAYVGFSGGTGGAVATQQISSFQFASASPAGTAYGNPLEVAAGMTGAVSIVATPASPSFSMGPLGMGDGSTLSLSASPDAAANQAYGLALGATTLAGPATFDVANNGTGSGTLTLGAVGDGGGAHGITKTGAGTLALGGANTYGGDTRIEAGTLALALGSSANSIPNSPTIYVHSGAFLDITGLSGGKIVLDSNGQTLAGGGTVLGGVDVGTGSFISPADSPGTMTTGAETWGPGGTYVWEINQASGVKGQDPGWDWLSVSGPLAISATSADPFLVDIASLGLDNSPGLVHDFDALGVYSWPIATATDAR